MAVLDKLAQRFIPPPSIQPPPAPPITQSSVKPQQPPSPQGLPAPVKDAFEWLRAQGGPVLDGGTPQAGSTLLSENIFDGQINCLDLLGDFLNAHPELLANSEVVFLRDTRDGAEGLTGHVVLRQGDQIWDPSTGQWSSTAAFLAAHPEYEVAGTAQASSVHELLSLPPGPERDAAIEASGINPALLSMLVADPPPVPSPEWLTQLLDPNVDLSTVTVPPYLEGVFQQKMTEGPEAVALWAADMQTRWEAHITSLWSEHIGTTHESPGSEQAVANWNAFVEEEMGIFFNFTDERSYTIGANNDLVHQPLQSPLLGAFLVGVGGGEAQWAEYTSDLAVSAQNLDLNRVFAGLFGEGSDKIGLFMQNPQNLCGQLSVASVTAWGVFNNLARLEAFLPNAAGEGDLATTPQVVIAMLNALQIEGAQAYSFDTGTVSNVDPAVLDLLLDQDLLGGATIALVNIDEDGHLHQYGQGYNATENIPHWVRILDVSEDALGNPYVRLYNPRNNREEVYSWAVFQSAWDQTDGGSTFTLVTTQPVDPTTAPTGMNTYGS
jgi:hypothetical protein